MIILDTNVVSELFRQRPQPAVLDWVETVSDTLAITSVTAAELLAGISVLPEGRKREALLARVEQILDDYGSAGLVVPFDSEAAYHYADVVAVQRRAGRPIATADAQIAAICRSVGAACATRNVADFEHTRLPRLINPWATN